MNKQEVIEEGYLVAYLTEDLDAGTMQEIAALIDSDPQVASAYRDLQGLLESITFEYGIQSPEAVKRTLMERSEIMHFEPSLQLDTQPSRWFLAASIVLTLLSSFTALYFYNQWKSTDLRLAEFTARNIELAESYHTVNQELSRIRGDLSVLVSPEFSRIILDGTANAPGAKAVVYWNASEEEVYLNSANLASLPQNQQYQLWALIDGKPVDAGVFDANEGRFQIMRNIAQADAFAVTIENQGGSETPTLETLQVLGKTS